MRVLIIFTILIMSTLSKASTIELDIWNAECSLEDQECYGLEIDRIEIKEEGQFFEVKTTDGKSFYFSY